MRRGINPVVATVALIAIAVIVMMVIYFWAPGQDISAPKTATFIEIGVTPIDVDAREFLVTNMGVDYIEVASLDSVSGITCDFGVLTELAPGESAVCITSAKPYCEMTFFAPGTTAATTLMGGDCTPVATGHVPIITFIGEDTGGVVDRLVNVNFTATVTDADGNLDTVKLFTNISGGTASYAMAPAVGDDFTVTINAAVEGMVWYYAWANDTIPLENMNGTYWFSVGDNPPVIWNVFDNSSGEIMCGLAVSVNSTITDDIDVDSAWVDDGSTNRSMSDIGGNVWETTFTPGMVGVFRYYVKANDTGDQWDTSAMQDFDMVQNFMREYGSPGLADDATSIQQIENGGYIVAGEKHPNANLTVMEMSSNGSVVWAKEYGGPNAEYMDVIKQTSDGGYIVTGSTTSYGLGGDAFAMKLGPAGNVEWANAYGIAGIDRGFDIMQTSDGGYLLVGNMGVVMFDIDILAVKLTSGGVVQWAYRYGEALQDEKGWSVAEAPGGDFIITAWETNYTGGVGGLLFLRVNWSGGIEWAGAWAPAGTDSEVKLDSNDDYVIATGTSNFDGLGNGGMLAMKVNDSNGIEWAKGYGNASNSSDAHEIDMSGSDYVVVGSIDAGVDYTMLGMRLDSDGALEWAKEYGDETVSEVYANDLDATADNGMIMVGETGSYADAAYNGLLVKTDGSGDIVNCTEYEDVTGELQAVVLWDTWNWTGTPNSTDITATITTTAIAMATADITPGQWPICSHSACGPPHPTWSVVLTPSSMKDAGWDVAEGSMVIAGEKMRDDTPPIDTEVIVYKLDDDGNEVWSSTFNKDVYADSARAITKTSDGGYLVTGYAKVNFGLDKKVWTIKMNSTGGKEWESVFYSGFDDNTGWGSVEAADGYVVGGHAFNAGGNADVLILKLNKTDGTQMWNKTHHFAGHDYGYSIILDGTDFIIGGMSNNEFLVMKANSTGGHVWNSTFNGGAGTDYGFDITHADGGGYVITGRTNLDLWAIKVDTAGNEVWNTTFDSGAGVDLGAAITNVSDGYVIVGTAAADVLVVKLDLDGNYVWDQIYGGGGSDEGQGVAQTSDGGLAVGGSRHRTGSNYALWALKLNSWGEFW